MKKTLFAFMALATAFGATSCQSDEELTQPTGKPMVINAVAEGIGTKTRAEMAYKYDILWSENDQIYVKNSANNATFDLTAGEGTTEGTFACASSPFASGDAVEAFYPASLVKDGNLVWPAEQTSNTVVPMYSKKTLVGTGTENFSFASLGAMLQIVFTTSQADVTLKSITLKDDDATMSGTFNVDENGKAGITATDKAGITLDLGTGVPVGLAAKYFNIAVPAGTYSNLTITFTGTDNAKCTLKGNVTLDHNTVGRLTLTGKEFKLPFGQGTAKANIGSVETNVTWVKLWADGPKFAVYNVGVTDGKATSFGGYYAFGGSQDKNVNDCYRSGSLTGENDTATKLWGSNWRMPTKAELEALVGNCTCTWTSQNGVNGYLCTGNGDYAGNSIFLPHATYYSSSDGVHGSTTYYWSSTQTSMNYYLLYFTNSNKPGVGATSYPNYGYSVRAVLNESAE